jgi:hypothetical protein
MKYIAESGRRGDPNEEFRKAPEWDPLGFFAPIGHGV